MLESFYNYLVKELILGFFKERPVEKGSRYYMIIENEEHREGLMRAVFSNSKAITISQIYLGDETKVKEEAYDTFVLEPAKDSPGLIVGYDKTSTEDYLTTIRNSVGKTLSIKPKLILYESLNCYTLKGIYLGCQTLFRMGPVVCLILNMLWLCYQTKH